jgi:hypothetical protein
LFEDVDTAASIDRMEVKIVLREKTSEGKYTEASAMVAEGSGCEKVSVETRACPPLTRVCSKPEE